MLKSIDPSHKSWFPYKAGKPQNIMILSALDGNTWGKVYFVYALTPQVIAAKRGLVLILDGIEKAERNVLVARLRHGWVGGVGVWVGGWLVRSPLALKTCPFP